MSQKDESGFRLRGIWIADVASHGESGMSNEGRLGSDYCWEDHARDLLNMVSIFRREMPPPLVGLGHSMGAVNIVQLSLMHPRLFTTVVCVEPPLFKEHDRFDFTEAYHIVKRRDVWASKQDAVRQTLSGGLQRSWDPRAIKCWEQHAFRELPTLLYPQAPVEVAREAEKQSSRPVTLSTTKHHAMRAFCRGAHPSPGLPLDSFIPHRLTHPDISKSEHDLQKSPVYRPEVTSVFRHLPFLRPSCFFIYGANSHFFSASAPSRKDKLQTTGNAGGGSGGVHAEAVKDVLLEGVGHFAPFENPHSVAEATCQWLSTRIACWKIDQSEAAQTWASIGVKEKAMVEDDTQWWAKEWFSAKPRKGSSKGVVSLATSPSSKL